MTSSSRFILTVCCNDDIGIVAGVASALADAEAFITESEHYGDEETGLFFMRTEFNPRGKRIVTLEDFQMALAPVARRYDMQLGIYDASVRMKVILAVSKHGHCLNHILHKWHAGDIPIEVVGVVSNHDDMRSLVEWYNLPYHHIPILNGNKLEQEERLYEVIVDSGAELTVLARYMQVLSDDLAIKLSKRCINIHHSSLPSFKGAKPYHQAHSRGVKLVGATAHYVTGDLDEGPIIEQQTTPVDHTLTADEFVRLGKDVESTVLTRAVRWHAERRLQLSGQRTVVFRGAS